MAATVAVLASSGLVGCVELPSAALDAELKSKGPYTIVDGDPQRPAAEPSVSQAEWTLSRERLRRMRAQIPTRPFVERVQLIIVDPRTGRLYRARGAVAVSPSRAARMVLIGPGGVTAMDVWVTRDRFRFTIPSLKIERRGGFSRTGDVSQTGGFSRGSDLSQAKGLPIGFLRWWFLAPLDGDLLLARSSDREASFLLRDGDATVTLRTDGQHFIALRRENGKLEGLEWTSHGLLPRAGARGRYIDGELGLRVHIMIEEVLPDEPDPAAFLDPDQETTSL